MKNVNSFYKLFSDSNIQKLIFFWMAAWLAIAGGSIYVLPLFEADQYRNVAITFSYFMFFAILGSYYFKLTRGFAHQQALSKQLVFILLSTCMQFSICLIVEKLFPLNESAFNQILSSKFYFPLFSTGTLFAKLADICFQQVFIFGLVKNLKKMELSDDQTIFLFSLAFFAVHLPLVFSLKLYALYFIIPSSFAGLFFVLLILKTKNGLAFSVALHQFFYVALGLILRISY